MLLPQMQTWSAQVWSSLRGLLRREDGAVGFEYLLIIGGVSVVLVAAMAVGLTGGATGGGLIGDVVTGVCNAVATVVSPVTCE